jgi:hypothetical protein
MGRVTVSILKSAKVGRAKTVRMAVAVALVAGGAVVVAPTMASASDVGSACSGIVFGDKVTNNLAIKVNGIIYGYANVAASYVTSTGDITIKVAVDDTRSDGLAPYVRPQTITAGGDILFQNTRVINKRTAASGWVCTTLTARGLAAPVRMNLYGSVADAPSIPEPVVADISYANWPN